MILTKYAVKFRTTVFVLTVALTFFGISSYRRLPREGAPDITIPFVFVTAMYEGTAPEEMEKLVTIPLEKQFNDVENIKEMRSSTVEGMSLVSIEFMAGQDIDKARQGVKDKMDLARRDLPQDLDEPIVDAINFSSDVPVLILAVSGPVEPGRLKQTADELKNEIELVPGVRKVELSGVREREIRVELDAVRLSAYRLPVGQVMQRIAQENVTLSAGNLEVAGNKLQLRVPGEYALAVSLRDLPVAQVNGRTVFLRDVATVSDTYKDLSSVSRLNGQPCVSLSVKKRTGENTVKMIGRIKDMLAGFRLPPDLKLTTVMDESKYVDMMIKDLENNIISGFLLVIAVLLLFMGWRNSLLVAIAIPLSLCIGFTYLEIHGETLNMIVLFSLVLVVGMLVDNGIVIVENIYRNRCLGLSAREAALRGAAEVAWPVTTSTLTTVAAFLPLMFWPGIIGQFMGFLPFTVIVVLMSSLFVALVVNPAICSVWVGAQNLADKDFEQTRWARFVRGYDFVLRAALAHRWVVLVIGFLLMALTLQLFARFTPGVELFPEVAPRNASVRVKFPQGTSIQKTDATLAAIEKKMVGYEDVAFILATAGGGSSMDFFGSGGGGPHMGSIHVEFVDAEQRKGNTLDLVARIRSDVGRIPGAEVTVEKQQEGPPTGAPVSIEISGDDFETLSTLAGSAARTIETVPGLVDLRDDFEEALPELSFVVDRQRAAMLGTDTRDLGGFLRTCVYGTESSRLRMDEEEFDITLRLPEEQRNRADLLGRIQMPLAGGVSVPLSSLGTVSYRGGRGAISRKDQKRVITLVGNNQGRGADKILKDVQARLKGFQLPRGYSIQYTGQDKDQREAAEFLSRAFVVAVALIFIIMVMEFNSTVSPFIIMTTVVMSMIGVMWGLLLCRMRFGVIMTGVGVISLAGVVVNNGIVLIDCINQRRAAGVALFEAVVISGRLRLRPVLLTAITTLLGLIPMAVGWSLEFHEWPPRIVAGAESSSWWAPMAVAVIFGLSLATVLTLVFVPVLYYILASVFRGKSSE